MTSTVPLIPAASVVLLRAAESTIELLMLRRNPSASSFAGSYVFPGGVLDSHDSEPRSLQRMLGLNVQEANHRLQLTERSSGLAHWMSAARECYEETGLLLAVDAENREPTVECLLRFRSHYASQGDRADRFVECLEREHLFIHCPSIPYLAHWVTPPIQPRRFDTRFFLARMPQGQQHRVDGVEMVDGQWLPPAEILARERRGELRLGSMATRAIVSNLGAFATPAAALGDASAMHHVPENRPRVAQGRGGRRIFQRHEAAYAEIAWVDRDETGTTSYELEAGCLRQLDRHCRRIVAPNPGLMTGPGTNTYLVGAEEVAVIDPGPDEPAHVEAILQHAGAQLRYILLTHTHADHAPAAQTLHRRTGAPILGGGPVQAGSGHIAMSFDRVLSHGEWIEVGEQRLRAIHTPGHASNHFCYWLEATRMLFTGDHLIQGSTVVIVPPDGNMRAYLRSLEQMRELEIGVIAPGHGYLIGEPQQEIGRIIHHRLAREEKVRRALREQGGSGTVASLMARAYADVPASLHPVAAHSLRAHLDKLVEDGELDRSDGYWTLRNA